MIIRHALRVLAGLVLAAATVAGCSSGTAHQSASSTPSAGSLLSAAKVDFVHARSVRISGHGSFNGGQLSVDLGMLRNGDVSGTFTAGTLKVEIVTAAGRSYAHLSKAYYTALRQQIGALARLACARVCGKWIVVPAGQLAGLNLKSFIEHVGTKLPAQRTVTHMRLTTYQGQGAYELSNSKGQKIFIAAAAPHYLLAGIEPGKFTLNFSQWNSVPPIQPPSAGEIVKV